MNTKLLKNVLVLICLLKATIALAQEKVVWIMEPRQLKYEVADFHPFEIWGEGLLDALNYKPEKWAWKKSIGIYSFLKNTIPFQKDGHLGIFSLDGKIIQQPRFTSLSYDAKTGSIHAENKEAHNVAVTQDKYTYIDYRGSVGLFKYDGDKTSYYDVKITQNDCILDDNGNLLQDFKAIQQNELVEESAFTDQSPEKEQDNILFKNEHVTLIKKAKNDYILRNNQGVILFQAPKVTLCHDKYFWFRQKNNETIIDIHGKTIFSDFKSPWFVNIEDMNN